MILGVALGTLVGALGMAFILGRHDVHLADLEERVSKLEGR